ncbi:nitrogen fixation protein NifZ [Novosphingobium sp. 1949]|uniref:Nitrogen fixation protein NifZ n=1 Tax=Novosphingobium organovorum TaxID=2930092 RepID=A0ABT0BAY7_9SPHN|nr:nitrogen fixation protein NifZ [Novosphingobium organovorum]MCJ2181964.1 nitrogen fixation protein NifZ [Novosphingobium organovorum]
MMDLREPIFGWGEKVRAALDLINDGSFPGVGEGAVLAARGTRGEIVNVGHHEETNQPVYLVEFDGAAPGASPLVVGCLEGELERPERERP